MYLISEGIVNVYVNSFLSHVPIINKTKKIVNSAVALLTLEASFNKSTLGKNCSR